MVQTGSIDDKSVAMYVLQNEVYTSPSFLRGYASMPSLTSVFNSNIDGPVRPRNILSLMLGATEYLGAIHLINKTKPFTDSDFVMAQGYTT